MLMEHSQATAITPVMTSTVSTSTVTVTSASLAPTGNFNIYHENANNVELVEFTTVALSGSGQLIAFGQTSDPVVFSLASIPSQLMSGAGVLEKDLEDP